MNWLFGLPLEFRLGIVFTLGVLVGTQVNPGIYRLAWNPRRIGPWSHPEENAPPRTWCDYLPIIGWYTLRRESKLHGAGYWLRPLTIELVMGVGLALLYWWEVQDGLTPENTIAMPSSWIHAQFAIHVVLIALMAVASFIDIDEKYIPDQITVFGALVGLALAAALPMSRLPEWSTAPPPWTNGNLLFVPSPISPPESFSGPRGLAMALGCFFAWWLAIIPSIWTTRHGLFNAVRFKLAGIRRAILPRRSRPREGWRGYIPILLMGVVGIVAVWAIRHHIGLWHWRSLLAALVGMAAGGAIVWGVRIVGTNALKMEAMGFGDVTLVAMIGAFLGWQPCLMLFFIAPFIGVGIALANRVLRGEIEIWFGPFLCVAALVVIVFWAPLWDQYHLMFSMGLLVPALVVIMFAMIWAMLILWRFIKEKIIFRGSASGEH